MQGLSFKPLRFSVVFWVFCVVVQDVVNETVFNTLLRPVMMKKERRGRSGRRGTLYTRAPFGLRH